MPRAKKICRVCGKEYEACVTPNTSNTFRWRDVACSPECGAEYLRLVLEARAVPGKPQETPEPENKETADEESFCSESVCGEREPEPCFCGCFADDEADDDGAEDPDTETEDE